jgi:GrpB-like predicted nucleotidyltransferase (UPF0157 family)
MNDARDDEELERYLAEVMIVTLEQIDIRLCDYDPAWPERFRQEAARIHEALGGRERRIEHIGSTSVPGLAAKPIVDMLLVLDRGGRGDHCACRREHGDGRAGGSGVTPARAR